MSTNLTFMPEKFISDEKFLKMNKLLEILCNPHQRIPLETLVKCEIALEKMDLKSYSMSTTGSQLGGQKEQQVGYKFMSPHQINGIFNSFQLINSRLIIPCWKRSAPIYKAQLAITHCKEHSGHVWRPCSVLTSSKLNLN